MGPTGCYRPGQPPGPKLPRSHPLDHILIVNEPEPVTSPDGLVYSTHPRTALAKDGNLYYLKGPELEVVVAEAVGYELASMVGLPVPHYALCHVPGDGICFASRELPTQSLEPLLERGRITNPAFLPSCIAFDIWVANEDRNLNNLVAIPRVLAAGAHAELYAIDFEKSHILRGTDFLTVGAMESQRFWPTGLLGTFCASCQFPDGPCDTISEIRQEQIEGIFERLSWSLDGARITWAESATHQLASRARRINVLAEEAWNGQRR
jgi:hypothetical protein